MFLLWNRGLFVFFHFLFLCPLQITALNGVLLSCQGKVMFNNSIKRYRSRCLCLLWCAPPYPRPPPFVWLHCADRFTTVLLSYLQNSTMSCERFKSVWCVQVSWVHFDGLWQYCHGVLIVSWSTYNLINDSNPILLSFLVIWHRSESPAHTVYRQKKNHILLFSLLL